MHIGRHLTTAGEDPYATVPFRTGASEIRNPDGSVVFQAERIEVPAEWSQVACDILAQKYFRKAGVPARLTPVAEGDVQLRVTLRVCSSGSARPIRCH
jgi:ribonucleoside-diphosphate reductase alpha chain